jgi:hypothetical protein
MARRRNYGFERRQKETLRQARQEAKRGRKAERADQGETGPEMGSAQEAGPPPGQWEWFSPSRSRVVATVPKQRPPADPPDDWVLLTEVGTDQDGGDTPPS